MWKRGKGGGGLLKNVDKSCLFNPSVLGVVLQTPFQFNDIIIH